YFLNQDPSFKVLRITSLARRMPSAQDMLYQYSSTPGASGRGFRVANYRKPKPMKTYRIFPSIAVASFCLALFALSFNASALTIGDEHELGTATPSIPQGDTAITSYVNAMLGLSPGGTTHVIIGPHDNLVTRSQNDLGA